MKRLAYLIVTILCLVLFACSAIACVVPNNPNEGGPEQGGPEQGGPQTPTTTYYKVTFKQEGKEDFVIEVESGKGVAEADIPELEQKDGYTVAWETVDLTNITADVTVNAVYTPIPVQPATKYTITLDYGGFKTNGTVQVEKGQTPQLPKTIEIGGKTYEITWKLENGEKYNGAFEFESDITLTAVYSYWSENN